LLASLVNIFNFPLYLLGGGMTGAWDLFEPPMLAELERRSFIYRKAPPRIERAGLGGDAGLFGAAYLPLQG
jgi:glucokinase